MSYMWGHTGLGADEDVLTEDEARYVDYELPRKQYELEKARFEQERRLAPWEMLTGIASGLLPLLAFLGISLRDRQRGGG